MMSMNADKIRYLKGCLRVGADHSDSSTDRRNCEDTLEYIESLEKDNRDLENEVRKLQEIASGKYDITNSDGYHTFDELYYHRMILFSVITNQNPEKAWKSKLHHDSSMYQNYFIVGIETPEGQFSYHYHVDNWKFFNVKELERAPKWDGHKSEDVKRLLSLCEVDENARA